jgi:hypothetical protein
MTAPDHRPQVSPEVRRRNTLTGLLLAFIVLLVCLIAITRRMG